MAEAIQAAIDGDWDAAAMVFEALGHRLRLRILDAVRTPRTIPEVRVITGIADVQRHMQILHRAGLVVVEGGIAPKRWQLAPGVRDDVAKMVKALLK